MWREGGGGWKYNSLMKTSQKNKMDPESCSAAQGKTLISPCYCTCYRIGRAKTYGNPNLGELEKIQRPRDVRGGALIDTEPFL